jgi:hypothetical protein
MGCHYLSSTLTQPVCLVREYQMGENQIHKIYANHLMNAICSIPTNGLPEPSPSRTAEETGPWVYSYFLTFIQHGDVYNMISTCPAKDVVQPSGKDPMPSLNAVPLVQVIIQIGIPRPAGCAFNKLSISLKLPQHNMQRKQLIQLCASHMEQTFSRNWYMKPDSYNQVP